MLSVALGHLKTLASKSDLVGYAWVDFFESDPSGKYLGGLSFIDGCHPGNDYLGVRADDALSASLLQARLCELGENIRVELLERGI